MENNCILCDIPIEGEEFCESCLEFLKRKYPDENELERILEWHKKQTELNKKC
jgi:hypothetical protein